MKSKNSTKKTNTDLKGVAKKQLSTYRKKIDGLDQKILKLLSQRGKVVQAVGALKQKNGGAFHVPERESSLIRNLQKNNPGPYPAEAIAAIYRELISASLALEAPLQVAYLGPQGTYSYLAARRQFGHATEFLPQSSPREIFNAVATQQVNYGILPIENSIEGVVTHNLDLFMDFSLSVCGEVSIPIVHHLLSQEKDFSKIKTVYSHPHALPQCRKWLDKNLAQAKQVAVDSTTIAAQKAKQQNKVAAIASEYAAELYRVPVRAKRIEDYANNFTRFLVLGREQPQATGHDKTSVMFSVKDEPGVLFKILKPLASSQINLTKIESRPLKKRTWEYIFFIDMDGHCQDADLNKVLSKMEQVCHFVQVLGSYPKEVRHG